MIRINLLTEARAAAAKKKGPALPTGAKLNNLLLIGGLLLGLIYIATMGLVLTSKRRHLDEEIGKAKEEVARLKSIIDEVKSYEDKKKSLEEKIDLINNLKTNQNGPVRLMDEVSQALPDLVWLTDLQVAGQPAHAQGQDPVAQRRGDVPREPEEEPVLRRAGFQEPRPRGGAAGHLLVGDDGHLHQRAAGRGGRRREDHDGARGAGARGRAAAGKPGT